jgi:hypothetical protein
VTSAHAHHSTRGYIHRVILPLVEAAVEYASALLGNTLTTSRLMPITLYRVRLACPEATSDKLVIRTLILLLRQAAQAVEMWWRDAAVDFVDSDIAFSSFLSSWNHHTCSYTIGNWKVIIEVSVCRPVKVRTKTGVEMPSRVLRCRARLGGVGVVSKCTWSVSCPMRNALKRLGCYDEDLLFYTRALERYVRIYGVEHRPTRWFLKYLMDTVLSWRRG